MPITPTEKIWMNGELVAVGRRQDPRPHAHAALRHAACSRASAPTRPTTGPAVFRLTEHIERLFNSAQDHDDGDPVHGRRARAGGEGHRARRPACRRATSGRSRTTATARWGSTRCRARSTCRSRAGRGARTSATTRVTKGVRMKISSWTRHDHNTMPPLVEDDGQLRELVARQGRGAEGRLRRGDHAQPRQGSCRECTGENIFVGAQRRARSRRRSSAGALPGHHAGLGDDDRARPRLRGAGRRPLAQRPLHRRGDVRVRHRGRGRAR